MEAEFLSLGLDIIGLGVFNYDFGSITTESPVIKARWPAVEACRRRLGLRVRVRACGGRAGALAAAAWPADRPPHRATLNWPLP